NIRKRDQQPSSAGTTANFLPGPVDSSAGVRRAFASAPVSHRGEQFLVDVDALRAALCRLVGANHVQLLSGSGTLANDVIAAQLSLLDAPGIILSNGEFGERLIDHARRMRLSFDAVRLTWGDVFDVNEVARRLDARPD